MRAASSIYRQVRRIRDEKMDDQLLKYDSKRMEKMYQFPAEYEDAQLHVEATKFGYNRKKKVGDQHIHLCACCQTPINVKEIGLCYPTQPQIRTEQQYLADKKDKGSKKLKFLLNSGSSMFFAFIKLTFTFLIIRFVIADVFNVYTNLTAPCSQACGQGFMAQASIFNKKNSEEQIIVIDDLLNLVLVIVSIIFFFSYQRYQFRLFNEIDRRYYTQDDFTIFLENIPVFIPTNTDSNTGEQVFYYEDYIKTHMEQQINKWVEQLRLGQKSQQDELDKAMIKVIEQTSNFDKVPKVRSISLCQDLSEIEKVKAIREELMDRYLQLQKEINGEGVCCCQTKDWEIQYFGQDYLTETKKQISMLNEQFVQLSKRFASDDTVAFNFSHFLGKALVTFEYQHYRDYFEREFRFDNKIKFQGREIKISRAADPTDVFWYNMKLDDSQRKKKIAFSFVIMMMVLATVFGALVGLQLLKTTLNKKLKQSFGEEDIEQNMTYMIMNTGLTSAMSGLTVAVDFLLSAIIKYLTDGERHKTSTEQMTSLIIKNVIAQFINTAFIYYVIFTIQSDIDPMSQEGIVAQVINLVTLSSLIKLGLNAFQLGDCYRQFKNKNYGKTATTDLFQVQLNKKLELPAFQFAERYSEYIVFCLIANFYAYITPLATIIIAMVIFAQYWVDKYNLFKRFSCPVNFTYRLSKLTLKILQASVVVMVLGNILFLSWVEKGTLSTVNIVTIVVAVVYYAIVLIFPKRWQEKIFEFVQTQTKSFSQCLKKRYFTRCYWRTNPATSFAKQQDINDNSKSIDYGFDFTLTEKGDFNNLKLKQQEENLEDERLEREAEERQKREAEQKVLRNSRQ